MRLKVNTSLYLALVDPVEIKASRIHLHGHRNSFCGVLVGIRENSSRERFPVRDICYGTFKDSLTSDHLVNLSPLTR